MCSGCFGCSKCSKCSGVQGVQGVQGVRFQVKVNDILEGQKGDQGGRPQNGQNFGWGEISPFSASFSAKKVLPTAEKVGSAQN